MRSQLEQQMVDEFISKGKVKKGPTVYVASVQGADPIKVVIDKDSVYNKISTAPCTLEVLRLIKKHKVILVANLARKMDCSIHAIGRMSSNLVAGGLIQKKWYRKGNNKTVAYEFVMDLPKQYRGYEK